MNIASATKIHLVGIKGVGMAAVACCLSDLGKTLTGSDSPEPQITDTLLSERGLTARPFAAANITPDLNLVIYSGAYKLREHPELLAAQKLNIPTISQAQAAAELTTDHQTIAVCGVGGKTTTTAMLIHLFESAGRHPSWLVGVSQVGAHMPPGKIGSGDQFIIEADEYAIDPPDNRAPKFSLYTPQVIVCTNLQYDHPDIYPNFQATQTTFLEFFQKLPAGGLLVYHADDPVLSALVQTLPGHITKESFGTSTQADWHLEYQPQKQLVTLTSKIGQFSFSLLVPGLHNAKNAAAAAVVASHFRVPPIDIQTHLTRFTGTKRRLELVASHGDTLYFDDYAHHPSEIKAAIEALGRTYPTKRLLVVFQPHTFTRTKALLYDFAKAFSKADQVIIAPIFSSARERPDPTISSQILAAETKKYQPNVLYLPDFDSIAQELKKIRRSGDIILTLGAGNIYQLHSQLSH